MEQSHINNSRSRLVNNPEYLRMFVGVQEGSHHAARTYKPRSGADTEIHAKIADISLTVDAAEYFGCDKPVVVPVVVPLPAKARKVYDQMEKELFAVNLS